jgi:uncharacterized membrane protein
MQDSTTLRNIEAICEVEKAALDDRSLSAHIGDRIATEAGRMWFIIFHALWFGSWIVLNLNGSKYGFDPYPYSLLTMVVSLESIFLSLFILMSDATSRNCWPWHQEPENRSGRVADRRNHLDLQINLLAEGENTKMLQMLQALCKHHNLSIGKDPEVVAMAERTEVRDVLTELEKNLPEWGENIVSWYAQRAANGGWRYASGVPRHDL